jgi:hypothetical protein
MSKDTGLDLVLTAVKGRIDWQTKGDKKSMEQSVLKAFAAVPPDVQGLFLGLGGRIIIADDANAICTDSERQMADVIKDELKKEELKALSEDLNSVTACYLFAPPSVYKTETGVEGQLMSIVISASVSEIQHSLVRSVGYLVANVFSKLVVTEGDASVMWMSADNPAADSFKQRVADGFLKDISSSNFAPRFAKYQKDGKASTGEKRSFNNFVFAEAFDSFYCNVHSNDDKNTLKTMIKSFPSTYSAFSGHEIKATLVSKKSEMFGASAESSINVGVTSGLPQIPFSESMVVMDWMKETIDTLKDNGQSPVRASENSAFALAEEEGTLENDDSGLSLAGGSNSGGGITGWFNNWVAKPVGETVTGVGVLYNDYSKARDQGIQRRMDQYSAQNGGKAPGFGQTMMAAAGGISDGTGYTKYFNNSQQAFQQRERQGQSAVQAFGGSISDSTGYTNVYNRISNRTNNIAGQVMSDPRWSSQSPLYRGWMTASVAANGALPELTKVPGKVGEYISTAASASRAWSGGTFDDAGNYRDLSRGERFSAGFDAVKGVGSLSGATKWATDKVKTSLGNFGMDTLNNMSSSSNSTMRRIGDVGSSAVIGAQAGYNKYIAPVYKSGQDAWKKYGGSTVSEIQGVIKKTGEFSNVFSGSPSRSASTTTTRPAMPSGSVGGGGRGR